MYDHVGLRVKNLDASLRFKNNGAHIAFRAKDRVSVDRFHAAGLKADGRDNGSPGPRPNYGAAYYAAFLIDPDGNNVEAVCLAKE